MAGCHDEFEKDEFEIMFNQFDEDKSGELEKSELMDLIKLMMNGGGSGKKVKR